MMKSCKKNSLRQNSKSSFVMLAFRKWAIFYLCCLHLFCRNCLKDQLREQPVWGELRIRGRGWFLAEWTYIF
jgi:hypothetical protein